MALSQVAYQTATAQTVVTTAETAVQVTGVVPSPPSGGQGVRIRVSIQLTVGTAGTSLTVRVRQGNGLTGTIVGNPQAIVVAAGIVATSVEYVDYAPPVNGQYTATVTVGAATGNSTVNQAVAEVAYEALEN
jgi:hypothetical protein